MKIKCAGRFAPYFPAPAARTISFYFLTRRSNSHTIQSIGRRFGPSFCEWQRLQHFLQSAINVIEQYAPWRLRRAGSTVMLSTREAVVIGMDDFSGSGKGQAVVMLSQLRGKKDSPWNIPAGDPSTDDKVVSRYERCRDRREWFRTHFRSRPSFHE